MKLSAPCEKKFALRRYYSYYIFYYIILSHIWSIKFCFHKEYKFQHLIFCFKSQNNSNTIYYKLCLV